MRPHRIKRIVTMFDRVMRVDIGAARMWGLEQETVEIISPCVVRAGDRASQLFGGINQYHTAMAADIFKNINIAILIANQQNWKPSKIDRLHTTWLRNVFAKANRHPIIAKHGVLFMLIYGWIDITGIWQAVACFNGACALARLSIYALLILQCSGRCSVYTLTRA